MGCVVSVRVHANDKDYDCYKAAPFDRIKYNESLQNAEDNLEKFIQQGITFGNRVEAVKKFLQNADAMKSFTEFLKSEEESCNVFDEIDRMIKNNFDAEKAAKDLVAKYTQASTSSSASTSNRDKILKKENSIISSNSNNINNNSHINNINKHGNINNNSISNLMKSVISSNGITAPPDDRLVSENSVTYVEDHIEEELKANVIKLLVQAADITHEQPILNEKSNGNINNDNLNNQRKKSDYERKNAYQNAKREVMYVIAIDAMPRYLESDYYKLWREEEVENNYAAVQLQMELDRREGLEYSYKALNKDLDCMNSDKGYNNNNNNNNTTTTSYIKSAFAALDPLEVPNISKSCFLSTFLGSVEGLPISVSLSTASMSRPGFPLIYVNAIFEETTGYTRREIIGQNCKFLQASKSEKASILLLSKALKEAKAVRVEITNYRKNGESFRNLLAMKPIFDHQGKYVYVVGLQFDVTSESASLAKLQLVDYLLSMLPDKLPYDDLNELS